MLVEPLFSVSANRTRVTPALTSVVAMAMGAVVATAAAGQTVDPPAGQAAETPPPPEAQQVAGDAAREGGLSDIVVTAQREEVDLSPGSRGSLQHHLHKRTVLAAVERRNGGPRHGRFRAFMYAEGASYSHGRALRNHL